MIKKIKYINWDRRIFFGFYDSVLYSSDSLYNLCDCDEDLQENEYYDFYDDDKGNYTYTLYEQAVCVECVKALFDNIQQEDKIIQGIKFITLHSPKYYNFETDKIETEVVVDWDKLLVWVQENCGAFNEYLHNNFTSSTGFTSFIPNNYNEFFDCLQDDFERLSQIVIEFYILQNLDYDSYFQDCAEIADNLIRDYVKVVKD